MLHDYFNFENDLGYILIQDPTIIQDSRVHGKCILFATTRKKCLNPYQMDFYRSLIHRTSSESQINGNQSWSLFSWSAAGCQNGETEFVYIITRAL